MRNVVWFSCGAASAVAAKLAVKELENVDVVYCDTGGEHPDNKRFLKDVEKWICRKVTILKNEGYADHFDVVKKTKFINGPFGARCTIELKKVLRHRYQRPDDIHIFGYTIDEQARADRFDKAHWELSTDWILIRHGLSKEDVLGIIWKSGIELPSMYKLGYNHNNCIGCVKGGMGYWNMIRNDFPEQFNRMARIEREIGNAVINGVYLDELDPNAGRGIKEPNISCGLECQIAMQEISES